MPEGADSVRQLSAVQVFKVAASFPTASDLHEQTLKDALKNYGLAKAVFDGASGVMLEPRLIREARDEELGEIHKHRVWDKVPRTRARARGKRVIGTKWVGINKGDSVSPKYRSRLVAKELRAFAPWVAQEELYALHLRARR